MSKRSVPLHPRWRQRLCTAAIRIVCATAVAIAPPLAQMAVAGVQEPGTPTGPFTLRGTVRDAASAPISSAVVSIFGVSGSSTTNEKGEFSLTGLPGGTRVVQTVALGYKPRAVAVAISNDTPPLVVSLQRANVILDSMHVVGKRSTDAATRRASDRITEKELLQPDILSVNALEAFALLRPQLFVGRPAGGVASTTYASERGRYFIRDNAGADAGSQRQTCFGNRACDVDSRLSVSINEGARSGVPMC